MGAGKMIARVVVLGVMVAGAVLLNSKPAAAQTCMGKCTINYADCLQTCHGNGTCAALCEDGYQACLKACE